MSTRKTLQIETVQGDGQCNIRIRDEEIFYGIPPAYWTVLTDHTKTEMLNIITLTYRKMIDATGNSRMPWITVSNGDFIVHMSPLASESPARQTEVIEFLRPALVPALMALSARMYVAVEMFDILMTLHTGPNPQSHRDIANHLVVAENAVHVWTDKIMVLSHDLQELRQQVVEYASRTNTNHDNMDKRIRVMEGWRGEMRRIPFIGQRLARGRNKGE